MTSGGASLQVRVQRLRQHDGRGGVAAQVALQRGVAKAGGVVVLKQRSAVDHRIDPAKVFHHTRQQAAHGNFIVKISIKMAANARQACASSYGFNSIFLGRAVMHGDLPAASGQRQRNLTPQAPSGAGD